MTGIVEQAARVLCKANGGNPDFTPKSYVNGIATGEVHDPLWVDYVEEAQALADAGLLRDPARTVPTRDQIAEAIAARHWDQDSGDVETWENLTDDEQENVIENYLTRRCADVVLALLEGGNDGT